MDGVVEESERRTWYTSFLLYYPLHSEVTRFHCQTKVKYCRWKKSCMAIPANVSHYVRSFQSQLVQHFFHQQKSSILGVRSNWHIMCTSCGGTCPSQTPTKKHRKTAHDAINIISHKSCEKNQQINCDNNPASKFAAFLTSNTFGFTLTWVLVHFCSTSCSFQLIYKFLPRFWMSTSWNYPPWN